ncbi:MAG: nucleotide-diphospho-sugar transferase [Candidatus Pacearchaeota archaeon]
MTKKKSQQKTKKAKKPEAKLDTPVLFLVFNRPETTKRVFQEIRKAKPTKLYIAADGPRTKKEKKKTDAVRNYILKNIDWKCKVKKLFRKENLGCKYAVSGAIDWFFENEEQGIILEDDCLPSQSFFRFCQELLEKYSKEDSVKFVCGTNFFGELKIKNDYVFSKAMFCPWGWATWKRSWGFNEEKMKLSFSNNGKTSPYLLHRFIFRKKLKDTFKGKTSSWAYILNFKMILEKGVSIFPRKNLVENIDFITGTHDFSKIDKKYQFVKRKEINFPLKNPKKIKIDRAFDRKSILKVYRRIIFKKIGMLIK